MNSIDNILVLLKQDYPTLKFKRGKDFHWSSKTNTVYYSSHQSVADHGVWALLHEVAHAQLGHKTYYNDYDLLKIENETWIRTIKIASNYNITIDKDHIQDCLDTYRDWLHNRAKCPKCKVVSLQQDD